MNKVLLVGRFIANPAIRTWQNADGETKMAASWTLAIDRRTKKDEEQSADFINCAAFGRIAEKADENFAKGIKISVVGHLQSGSYTAKDGRKVYTTTVIVEDWEYMENKEVNERHRAAAKAAPASAVPDEEGYMPVPEDELPFV